MLASDVPGVVHGRRRQRAMHRVLRSRDSRHPAVKLLALPELAGIELPQRVPNDTPYVLPDRHQLNALLRPPIMYWDQFGNPIIADVNRDTYHDRVEQEFRRDVHLAASAFHRDGRRIEVSTIFLVLDFDAGYGGTPILWETMIFQVDSREHPRTPRQVMGHQWRYRSPEAALAGHRQVCAAIADEQRRRRRARWTDLRTAPIRTVPRGQRDDRDPYYLEEVYSDAVDGALHRVPVYTVTTGPDGEFVALMPQNAGRVDQAAIAGDIRRRFQTAAAAGDGQDPFDGMRVPPAAVAETVPAEAH